MKKPFPLSRAYQLLEPGPVVLLTTGKGDKEDVMTMSWHMMIDFEPPLVGCIVSNRNYSFELLKKAKECVINIPSVELAKQVVGVGNTTGRKVNKFQKFGLTKVKGSMVKTPMIDECFANLECRVIDAKLAAKYNLFILEVVNAWKEPSKKRQRTIHHCGNGNFVVDGELIKLKSQKK